jgi:hypothetical protein
MKSRTKERRSRRFLPDPASLPSLPLARRSKLPCIECIYFLIHRGEVVYIGTTTNLKRRWSGHPELEWYKARPDLIGDAVIAWWAVASSLRLYLEGVAIRYWVPRFNGLKDHYGRMTDEALRKAEMNSETFYQWMLEIGAIKELPIFPPKAPRPVYDIEEAKKAAVRSCRIVIPPPV